MKKYIFLPYPNFIFVDKINDNVPNDYTQVTYNQSHTYVSRLLECFQKIKSFGYEYCFFEHEDMFLYDLPKIDKILKYTKAVESGEFDFIKLIKGGDFIAQETNIDETLFRIDLKSQWIFSIQPSIWKIEKFIELLSHHSDCGIWDFEEKSQNTCRLINVKGGYSDGVGHKVGLHHYSNDIYPYVATAIVKGKWNTSEYDILYEILHAYGVDIKIRGEF
jgi:hypothetical protein